MEKFRYIVCAKAVEEYIPFDNAFQSGRYSFFSVDVGVQGNNVKRDGNLALKVLSRSSVKTLD